VRLDLEVISVFNIQAPLCLFWRVIDDDRVLNTGGRCRLVSTDTKTTSRRREDRLPPWRNSTVLISNPVKR